MLGAIVWLGALVDATGETAAIGAAREVPLFAAIALPKLFTPLTTAFFTLTAALFTFDKIDIFFISD